MCSMTRGVTREPGIPVGQCILEPDSWQPAFQLLEGLKQMLPVYDPEGGGVSWELPSIYFPRK